MMATIRSSNTLQRYCLYAVRKKGISRYYNGNENLYFADLKAPSCLSQWSRGLRLVSAAARLLGLWVRIPPEHGCLFLVRVVYVR